jgi:hypothetical protein
LLWIGVLAKTGGPGQIAENLMIRTIRELNAEPVLTEGPATTEEKPLNKRTGKV